eukprot:1362616-Amphidinium_carterae.1
MRRAGFEYDAICQVAQKGQDTPLRDIPPDSHLKALVEHRTFASLQEYGNRSRVLLYRVLGPI